MHKDPLSSFFFFQDDAAYKIDCHDHDVSFSDRRKKLFRSKGDQNGLYEKNR